MSEETPKEVPSQQSQLKLLIARGKEQGYLTYAEVNDHLPPDIVDPDQVEDIISMINDMGIQVFEVAPEADALLMNENAATDEDAADEAAAVKSRSQKESKKGSVKYLRRLPNIQKQLVHCLMSTTNT